MQPEVKLSKFMFHLRFSRKEDYVHEHELYEVMRSRNLYQYQFSVRSNFQKRMRNIEISEKAQKYGFENSRKLFVQKMRERREQADKSRSKYDTLVKKLRTDLDGKKSTRRYVPIPASTIVYEELPAIMPQPKSQESSMMSVTHRSEGEGSRGSSPVQAPPTPSAIAATILSAQKNDIKKQIDDNSISNFLAPPTSVKKPGSSVGSARNSRKSSMVDSKEDVSSSLGIKQNDALGSRNTSVLGSRKSSMVPDESRKNSINPDTIKIKPETINVTTDLRNQSVEEKREISVKNAKNVAGNCSIKDAPKDKDVDIFVEDDEEYERKRREFESRAIKGHGKQHTSTVHFSEDPPTDKAASHPAVDSTLGDAMSKIEAWREKHGLVSKTDVDKDPTLGRLMIDRPSKWALGHVHGDPAMQSTELGMRYQMLKTSLRRFDNSFKKKSQQLDDLSLKLRIRSKQKVSLPELDTTPKPMVRLDPGGTTPDGRLILTKADYEDYLSDYRKARVVRLERSKKKTKLLYKLIENFNLDPKHRLIDDTDLSSEIHTI